MGGEKPDIEKVIRRAVRKLMLYHSEWRAKQDRRYVEYISAALRHKEGFVEAMEEIERQIDFKKPVVFLTPGRSGLFLGRLFLEYLREKERVSGKKYPRGWPTLLTLPIRPRRVYVENRGDYIHMGELFTTEFLYRHLKNRSLYRDVFERAKRGEIQLVYLDAYEYKGLTRRVYENLARRFGVPEEAIKTIILSKSRNPDVYQVGAYLIDGPSHRLVWKTTKKRRLRWGGKTVLYEEYVRGK
ncbi:TPA: hypothetical protein EYP13_01565 [Candidatus Micrarchaeota archaeon]|nr:hypothetical protein [Candidatus Micrarchaeota archaeon]